MKILKSLSKFLPLFLILFGVNSYVDPLHLFNRKHGLNKNTFFDQRLIKTNIINYEHPVFNSLLIGSSRVQILGNFTCQHDTVLNFGCGDLMPADYAGFIDFIKSHNKNSLNFLLIGLDFFGSSNFRFSRANWLETKDYIKNSNDWYYLFKLFISPNCFKYSIKNLYGSLSRKSADPVHSIIMNMNELEKNEIYFDDIYGHYQYNNNYVRILKDIINANTDARIIIFTTPVAKCHFDLILQYHLYDEYEKWLTDLTNVCEGYYNFMDITPLTNDPKNWADANHLTSEVGIKMIRKLLQNLCQDTDNYTYVTADKVKTYLENIRMKLEL